MNKILGQKTRVVAAALLVLIMALGIPGCGGAQAAGESQATASPAPSTSPSKTKATAATSSKSPSPSRSKPTSKATPTPSKTVIPKLTDVSFTLALEEEQEYTENTTPIYLKAYQTLHLNWLVVKGGDHIFLTFTRPSGELITVRNNGTMAACSSGEIVQEQLTKSGDLVFRPEDNNWGEGYYLFHPQIHKYDPAVTVKLLYWVE